MFYWLTELSNQVSFFNVFRYITFRTGGAVVTALVFVFLFGGPIIDMLRVRQGKGQPIRSDGPASHLITKKGTPTMGGLMILSGLLVSTLLWANPMNPYVWIVLGVTLSFGLIGFYDDYLKVTKQTHAGISGKARMAIEVAIAVVACVALMRLGRAPFASSLVFPFFKEMVINLGWFFVAVGAFVIVGAGNAVNLTDGLDGLAIVPVMIAAASFGLISYLAGNAVFAEYLQIHYVAGTGELAVLCGALIGAGLGFLWFNAPPASIFMGDTGSLALGGMLGTVAVATKHEIVLAVIGGLFVLEAVSVIVQVVSFKLTGRRVFKMAPIHHHYEQMGWTEPQIVIRFWIVAVVLALAGLATLKLRMIPVTVFAGKSVAVFGLGGSGLASAQALKAGGANVICYDDDDARIADAGAAGLQTHDLHDVDWAQIAALVLAPGVPLTHPKPHWVVTKAREHWVEIIGDIELFGRERAVQAPGCPFIAITGTNGKSTTTYLIAHLLHSAGFDVQMGGNIGTPILALEPFAPNRVYVIEVSSYQIDLAPTLKPSVGVLLNVSEDHLDRHGAMENYAALKALVPASVEPNGTAVIAVDDRYCRLTAERVSRAGKNLLRVSVTAPLRDGLYAEGSRIVGASNGKAHPIAQLAGVGALRGVHNAQNAAAAIAVGQLFGIELIEIQKALTSFPGLPHRMEEVGRLGKVLYVNDSKATNADSAARALACFGDIFWIAGGKAKTGGITALAEFFPRIRKAYLIGEAAQEFAATLEGKVPTEISDVLSAAIDAATRDAHGSEAAEPVVLLSPACASFDQYRNFEARGTAFRDIVLGLPGVKVRN